MRDWGVVWAYGSERTNDETQVLSIRIGARARLRYRNHHVATMALGALGRRRSHLRCCTNAVQNCQSGQVEQGGSKRAGADTPRIECRGKQRSEGPAQRKAGEIRCHQRSARSGHDLGHKWDQAHHVQVRRPAPLSDSTQVTPIRKPSATGSRVSCAAIKHVILPVN